MKLQQQIKHEVRGSDFDTVVSKVNNKKLAKLYGMLSDIYRNPIGSIVREYASNAYDANKEAHNFATKTYDELIKIYPWIVDKDLKELNLDREKVNRIKSNLKKVSEKEPVVVGTIKDDTGTYFYVKDYGIGLSPERMHHIYFNYLDSTKEDTDGEIGGFGIGSKSALSYTHTFYIITVYDNVEYTYIMSKNKEGIPIGQLLNKIEDCGKDNGSTIKIPIQNDTGYTSDVDKFHEEIRMQLRFMSTAVFQNISYGTINKDFTTIKFNNSKLVDKGDYYLIKGYYDLNEIMICLGNIAYTIDWSELGIRSIDIPLALKFDIGELQPTPSRESVQYTKHSIALIKDRIIKILSGFVDSYNKDVADTSDFRQYLLSLTTSKHHYSIYENKPVAKTKIIDVLSNLGVTKKFNTLEFSPAKSLGLQVSFGQVFSKHFFAESMIQKHNGRVVKFSGTILNEIKHNTSKSPFLVYKPKSSNSSLTNFYILEKLTSSKHVIFYNKVDVKLHDYKRFLKLDGVDKSQWRAKIKALQNLIDTVVAQYSVPQYDKIVINPNWLADYKAGNSFYSPEKKQREESVIPYAQFQWNSYTRRESKVGKIVSESRDVIYGTSEDSDAIQNLYEILQFNPNLKRCFNTGKPIYYPIATTQKIFIKISKQNVKLVENYENTYTVKEYLENRRDKLLLNTFTYLKVRANFVKLSVFADFNTIHTQTYQRYANINNFYHKMRYGDITSHRLKEELLAFAEANNLYHTHIIDDYNYLFNYLHEVPLLKHINITNDSIPYVVDYLKTKKKRVNAKYYQRLNPGEVMAQIVKDRI